MKLAKDHTFLQRTFEVFLARQATCLVRGDVASLAKVFRAPLPIFHPGGLELLSSAAEVRASLNKMIATFRQLGIRDVNSRLLEYETKPASETVGCLMEFRYFGADSVELRRTLARYYLEPVHDSFHVVMLEYDQAAVPEIFPELGTVIPLPLAKD